MEERQPDRENETYAEAAARLLKVLDERSKKTVSRGPATDSPSAGLPASGTQSPDAARRRFIANENGCEDLQCGVFSHQKSRESQTRGGSAPYSGDDTAADRAGTSTPRVFK